MNKQFFIYFFFRKSVVIKLSIHGNVYSKSFYLLEQNHCLLKFAIDYVRPGWQNSVRVQNMPRYRDERSDHVSLSVQRLDRLRPHRLLGTMAERIFPQFLRTLFVPVRSSPSAKILVQPIRCHLAPQGTSVVVQPSFIHDMLSCQYHAVVLGVVYVDLSRYERQNNSKRVTE